MPVQAQSKYLKISAKKMRLVAVVIKGMDVSPALDYLKFVHHKASPLIAKTLHSAIANAEHNFSFDRHNLFVKEIFVGEGTMLKRWRARAFGRATPIHKKSSHLTIILEEKVPSQQQPKLKYNKLKEPSILKDNLNKKETETLESVHPQESKKQESKEDPQENRDSQEQSRKHLKEQNLKRAHNKSKAITLKKIFRRKSI